MIKPDQPRFREAANDGQMYSGDDKLLISHLLVLFEISQSINVSCCLNTIPRLVIRGERGVNEEWLKHYGPERILSSGSCLERNVRLVPCFEKSLQWLMITCCCPE